MAAVDLISQSKKKGMVKEKEKEKEKEKVDHTRIPTRKGDEDVPAAIVPVVIECNEEVTHGIGMGDCTYYRNFLTPQEADEIYMKLTGGEIEFQQWFHMPNKPNQKKPLQPLRRVKVAMATAPEGPTEITPHYRFPVNNQQQHGVITPMTPTIEALRTRINQLTGVEYNHSVVLLYRDGDDCIGYHKDKLLDLDEEAPIVSISLGMERWYHLRDDIYHPHVEYKVLLRHGGVFSLGSETNQRMYHSIPLIEGEGVRVTPRVSITFRRTLTYRDNTGSIVGKGAQYQTLNWPKALKGTHRIDDEHALNENENENENEKGAHCSDIAA